MDPMTLMALMTAITTGWKTGKALKKKVKGEGGQDFTKPDIMSIDPTNPAVNPAIQQLIAELMKRMGGGGAPTGRGTIQSNGGAFDQLFNPQGFHGESDALLRFNPVSSGSRYQNSFQPQYTNQYMPHIRRDG